MLNHHTLQALSTLRAEDLRREAGDAHAVRRALREQRAAAPGQVPLLTRLRWLFTPRLTSARVQDVLASLRPEAGPHGPLPR